MKLPKAFPFVVSRGNSRVTIYRQDRVQQGKGESFLVGFYVEGKRKLRAFASYEAARACAEEITGSVNRGDVDGLTLNARQKAEYLRAVEALGPTGIRLDTAAIQFADALTRLKGRPLSEAVDFYSTRMLSVKRKPVSEVVDELLESKSSTSPGYVAELRKRLKMLADAFQCDIAEVSP
ncbi:MAG: hypothetical protein EBT61_07420, partial [Verrucomicrobia bacterium]|nr:hypothetical protein [Verrucomicrobiota bacterium]